MADSHLSRDLLTIVFTDVVGSAAIKRHPALGRDNRERDRAYLEGVQTPYYNMVRECYRAGGGQEVSREGDAFYLAFGDPVEAIRCAADIQRRLADHPIQTPLGPLRLRIGIHSGYPEPFEGGYQGADVDKAARVEQVATEEQILLSSVTYGLVRDMTDLKFHRMGEFKLKGVGHEVLWEADWDGKGPRPTAKLNLEQERERTPPIPFAQISRLLKAGGVVPFLGAGAAVDSRPPGSSWDDKTSQFVPTIPELARYLAKKIDFPFSDDQELVQLTSVASYFVDTSRRLYLLDHLRDVFGREFNFSTIHTYLAKIASPLLIVTTSYDDTLERAFRNAERAFDLVIHPTDRKDAEASVLWWKHGADEPKVILPNRLSIDLKTTTVIYKMHGTADRKLQKWDSYIITEEDCLRLLSRTPIPPIFIRHCQQRHFLFLGYDLRDWNVRLLMKTLKKLMPPNTADEEAYLRSWAIQFEPSPWEKELWNARRVSLYEMEICDFVRELQEHAT